MLKDNYEKLSLAERETFARVTNQLLAHSFLLSDEFDYKEGISKVNRDYIFLERNYELFTEYLELAGFGLVRDSGYGVISLTSGYDGSRVHFDKLTTIMLYALRLIYEEEREKLTLSKEVALTVGELVHKLINLGVIGKKPANLALGKSLRMLSQFRILRKLEGAWDSADTRIVILPTVLFAVSGEQIANMARLVEEKDDDAAAFAEEDGAVDLAEEDDAAAFTEEE